MFVYNAKSFAIAFLFFLAMLWTGQQKCLSEYFIICHLKSALPGSDLFSWRHREIFHWWSVYCYFSCGWPLTYNVLYALKKLATTELREHICITNVTNVFHDVNSTSYIVASIHHKARIFSKIYQYFFIVQT